MKKSQIVLGLTMSLLFSGCSLNKTAVSQPETTPTINNSEESVSSSMREMIVRGDSLHCTFDYENSGNKSRTKGNLYLSGGKFFQDTTVSYAEPAPKEIVTKSLSDGEYLYSWDVSNPSSGIKIKIDSKKTEEIKQNQNDDNSNNLDKKIDMKCQKWTPDNAKFQIPSEIKFSDLSQMMEEVKSKIPSIPAIPTIPSNNLSE